jgi:hypothetical protein
MNFLGFEGPKIFFECHYVTLSSSSPVQNAFPSRILSSVHELWGRILNIWSKKDSSSTNNPRRQLHAGSGARYCAEAQWHGHTLGKGKATH